MVFSRADIYTSSGSVMLHNAWTPYVSKYDTSSFYNWEQDNLPLYDLEERTYELWEQQGFTTSAGVPGLSLTVSAHAGADYLAANTTIFTSLSAAIAAIPKVVRFPVLVEVCNNGDMGDLELHNFRIEEGGSIEIINRAFTKVYTCSSNVDAVVTPNTIRNGYAPLIKDIFSPDVSATLFSSINFNVVTSGVNVSSTVLSGAGDIRLSSVNSFLYPKLTLRQAPLSVALDQSTFLRESNVTHGVSKFRLDPYENVADLAEDSTLGTTDVSSSNQATGAALKRAAIGTGTAVSAGGNIYLNYLTKASVKNCDGPIYIRNFCVNGKSVPDGGEDFGFDVLNSEVVLENCSAARCREAGFKFNNSKVTLSRSAFSYRNYSLTTNELRKAQTGIGFHAINSDVSMSALVSGTTAQENYRTADPMAGDFQASGMDVIMGASRNYTGWQLDNSKLHGGFSRLFSNSENTGGITFSEQNTGYGMILNNSQVDVKGLLDIYGNDKGIQADTSEVTYENLCLDRQEQQAIRSKNSTFLFDSVTNPINVGQEARYQVDFVANGQHLDLQDESAFVFARKNTIPTTYGNMSFSACHGVIKWYEGNRAMLPALSVNNNSVLNLVHPFIHTRAQADSIANVPGYGLAVKASNNSVASLFGTGSGCNFIWGPKGYTYQHYTAGLCAENSSEINLHGPTAIAQFGVDALAENNSTINIQPPRIRDSWGLEASAFNLNQQANHTSVELHATRACLVANKNSTINMQDLGDYSINWGRTAKGRAMLDAGTDYHTGVTATSGLTMSGSIQFFPNPQDTSAIGDFFLADLENAGGLDFTIPDFPVFTNTTIVNTCLINDDPFGSGPNFTAAKGRQFVTQGGVCVRATEDSVVNAVNVHFPIGTNSSPLDGHYYSTSATPCERFGIWNIADTSRFNASYLSVSGMWPFEVQWHGPSALYASAAIEGDLTKPQDAGNATIASGAPAFTPQTGALSVHDTFGAGSSVWMIPSGGSFNNPYDSRMFPLDTEEMTAVEASLLAQAGINVSGQDVFRYGATEHIYNNTGCFRIYWSPKSDAKFLQNDLSGWYKGAFPHYNPEDDNFFNGNFPGAVGPAYQTFAQGYNCSAALSAITEGPGVAGDSVSGAYPDLLKLSHAPLGFGTLKIPTRMETSGFYYCKEMVDENPTQCMFDESAGFSFANAQNASLGSSGRPKKVTLYRSRSNNTPGSESYIGHLSGTIGFESANIFDLKREN
jgi:hypothetical protein